MKAVPGWLFGVWLTLQDVLAASDDDARRRAFELFFNHPQLKPYLLRRIGWATKRLNLSVADDWALRETIYNDVMMEKWIETQPQPSRTERLSAPNRAVRWDVAKATTFYEELCAAVDRIATQTVEQERRQFKRRPLPMANGDMETFPASPDSPSEEAALRITGSTRSASEIVKDLFGETLDSSDATIIADWAENTPRRVTADYLGITECAVRQRLKRLLSRLRERVGSSK